MELDTRIFAAPDLRFLKGCEIWKYVLRKKTLEFLYAKSSLIITYDLGYIYNQTRLCIKTINVWNKYFYL